MRIMSVAAVAALMLVGAGPAFSNEPTASSDVKPAKAGKPTKEDDPNRVVCTREHVVGTNRPQKVCMTVADRQRLKDSADRALNAVNQRPAPIEAGGR
ncbi:hypothetical protein [Caulobacter mirabilis]|uniref:Uncharacterized protein n=1 Tax=Caulobacter mirabilis TaxID=69666 RepID=A0A2D2AVQ4_9CAUL|nr:hypothetical protein [Caulobacter mirabilis]ATQ42084.1 hypothetical protein CSW64_06465 [Caulobacter mirabilis]